MISFHILRLNQSIFASLCEFRHEQKFTSITNGAFPLHGTVRLGTVRLSSGRFAFPLQFSTTLEWAGLFTRRYNCAASTAVTSS